MSTIGQRETETYDQRAARIALEKKRAERRDSLVAAGIVVGCVAGSIGGMLLLIFLVARAIRLGWGL